MEARPVVSSEKAAVGISEESVLRKAMMLFLRCGDRHMEKRKKLGKKNTATMHNNTKVENIMLRYLIVFVVIQWSALFRCSHRSRRVLRRSRYR